MRSGIAREHTLGNSACTRVGACALLGLLTQACGSRGAESGVAARQGVDAAANSEAATDDASVQTGALVPLLDHGSWRRYSAQLDPLASHQPLDLVCREDATFVELESYEIDTTRCNYVLSEHPSAIDLPTGSEVRVTLLHYDLFSPPPAEGHVALLFGDALQWEIHVPIPKPADVIEARFTSTEALEAGEPIRLHLHNHGGNTWLLMSVAAVR